ncbi:MAG: NapC/NirT family cytochrome c [Chloroflexi bacterium]|nr:NapC/NirT family cytochrome c [Chloroflexota bacterium]
MAESNNPEREPSPLRRAFTSVPLWSWLLLVGLIGAIIGLGSYTFVYAEGASYFSNDPAACVNCHIMQEVYDGWNHGSHKAVAGCNDCHTPTPFLPNMLLKASMAGTTASPSPLIIFPNRSRLPI